MRHTVESTVELQLAKPRCHVYEWQWVPSLSMRLSTVVALQRLVSVQISQRWAVSNYTVNQVSPCHPSFQTRPNNLKQAIGLYLFLE
jgi:hypothetical protein